MKINTGAAKSYAKALFDLARERNQADQIQTELDQIAQQIAGDAELMAVLGRPWVTPPSSNRLPSRSVSACNCPSSARISWRWSPRTGGPITSRRSPTRTAACSTPRMVVRARVRTAVPLTEADRTALGQRLGRALASNAGSAKPLDVVIEEVLDKHLLGGFVAEIGSMVVDGSLDGQLARMRERLVKG